MTVRERERKSEREREKVTVREREREREWSRKLKSGNTRREEGEEVGITVRCGR